MNIYKWLYTHLTPWIRRPWTYYIRDIRVKYPTPWMLGVLVVGAIIGHYFWSYGLLDRLIILLVGILWGHLWWGTKHLSGQEGE